MDGYLPAGFHKKKKRAKVISLQITAQLGIRRTSQIMEIFGSFFKVKLVILNCRVLKNKI